MAFCCSDDPPPAHPVTKRGWDKYKMCAWIRIASNYQGATSALLPSRWYTQEGDVVYDTLTEGTLPQVRSDPVPKDGEWHRYCEEITTKMPDVVPRGHRLQCPAVRWRKVLSDFPVGGQADSAPQKSAFAGTCTKTKAVWKSGRQSCGGLGGASDHIDPNWV